MSDAPADAVRDFHLAMQRAYPEGWRIEVVEVVADGPRVASRVVVHMGDERFWSHGWWTVIDGCISEGAELWGTQGGDTPPEWRRRFVAG